MITRTIDHGSTPQRGCVTPRKKRNTVERAVRKLKQAQAVATRSDKRGCVFLGTFTAATLVIWLRSP